MRDEGEPSDTQDTRSSERLAMADDALDAVFNIDLRIFKTFADIVRRPRQMVAELLDGDPKIYVGPLKALLFAVTVYFVIVWVLRGLGYEAFDPEQVLDAEGKAIMAARAAARGTTLEAEFEDFRAAMRVGVPLANVAAALPFAALLHRFDGRARSFPRYLGVSLHAFAAFNLCACVWLPLYVFGLPLLSALAWVGSLLGLVLFLLVHTCPAPVRQQLGRALVLLATFWLTTMLVTTLAGLVVIALR